VVNKSIAIDNPSAFRAKEIGCDPLVDELMFSPKL
jgi:hypothetical protein